MGTAPVSAPLCKFPILVPVPAALPGVPVCSHSLPLPARDGCVCGVEEEGAVGQRGQRGLPPHGDNVCQRGPIPAPSHGKTAMTHCVHSCDRAAGGHGHLRGEPLDSGDYDEDPQHSRTRDHHSAAPRAKCPHT